MGLWMKKYILVVHNLTFRGGRGEGGGSQKTNIEAGLPKKGAWTVFRFKGGAW